MTDVQGWAFLGGACVLAPIGYHLGWLLERWIARRWNQ